MNNTAALFACSKCFTRHPFEDLSAGQQLCKECRGAFPVVKCTYCRSEFQQSNKTTTSTICAKCEQNVKSYGKPSACEYCNIIAAFIGNKCQRCTNSERKYGPPITCEQCKQKCAFDRKDDDKKVTTEDFSRNRQVDGKLLCWLCTLSFKRALAKTKQTDSDRRAQMKIAAQRSSKNKDGRSRSHRRPKRVDVTKMNHSGDNSSAGLGGNDSLSSLPPPAKLQKVANHRSDLDPNSSDHVVAITQLKEQMASLQKQLTQKNLALRDKDKTITDLKAKHFTETTELRNKMNKEAGEFDKKVELMSGRIKSLQKEVATLSKSGGKRGSGLLNKTNAGGGGGGSGSGTDSPSMG